MTTFTFHYKKHDAYDLFPASVHSESASNRVKSNAVISLKLVLLIERPSDRLAAELVVKLELSSRTSDLNKVPVEELRARN